MSQPVIMVKNLSKNFGDKSVLNNISFSIYNKDSVVILGESGTGKSVLFKCILGILNPEVGEVFIKGKKASGISEKQRYSVNKNISIVFQNSALFDSYNILHNITFGIIFHRYVSKNEQIKIACEALEKVGLDKGILYLYPNEISGGMQKRVALARSIATKPDIIFFDEPTSGLDPISSTRINNLINGFTKDLGVTSITITHDIKSAKFIATKVLYLYKGSIVWRGSVNELNNSNNELVKKFVDGIPD